MTTLTILCCIYACAIIPATASGASRRSATTGIATYYTVKSCQREGTSGVLTASGARYVESAMTCALLFHPRKVNGRRQWCGKWRITNLQTGKSITVTHTDYGPGKKARKRGVVVDLTPAAFLALGGKLRDGRLKVKVEKLGEVK